MNLYTRSKRILQLVLVLLIVGSTTTGCWGRSAQSSQEAVAVEPETNVAVVDAQAPAQADAQVDGSAGVQPAVAENSAPEGEASAAVAAVPAAGTASEHEAPMLAEQVEIGLLPPLAERLPENPLVVEPVESIGQYGGTWRRVFRGINDIHTFSRVTYETMLRWPRDPQDPIQPGLAEDWSWSADGTELTLYLRKGMKWSDGAPFTTADITFWWEDIENNPNLTDALPPEWVVNGVPMELLVIDDYTITLKFVAPNVLAETLGLAFHGNQWPLGFERFGFFAPRHYLEQFHPDYNPEATYELFDEKAIEFNTERPVMTSWRISQWEDGATELIAERNPYYWKTDPEGNQLPYIDRVHMTLVANEVEANELALSGQVDMQARHMDYARIELFRQNAETGGYHLGEWQFSSPADLAFFPNQTYPDLKYRELMQTLEFRQALSISIDRELINYISFLGQATIPTQNVVPGAAMYQPDLDNGVMGYDPQAAIALLDSIGLPVDEQGYRTFPDGTPIVLSVETNRQSGTELDAVEEVLSNWNAIGLRTVLKTMSRDELWPRASENKVMISVWGVGRGVAPMLDPIDLLPVDERSWMAPAFGTWNHTDGEQGEEPNAEFMELIDLYDQYRNTPDEAQRNEIAKKIVRINSERVHTVNVIGEQPAIVIIKDNFNNVIENNFTTDWIILSPGTQDPAQYYFER